MRYYFSLLSADIIYSDYTHMDLCAKDGGINMGRLLEAKCTSCGHLQRLFVGGGLADCERDTIAKALPEKQRYLMEAGAVRHAERLSVDRVPARCPDCGRLFAQAVVSYTHGGRPGTLRGWCPDCGGSSAVDLTGRDTVEHACPQCGGNVVLEETGLWD